MIAYGDGSWVSPEMIQASIELTKTGIETGKSIAEASRKAKAKKHKKKATKSTDDADFKTATFQPSTTASTGTSPVVYVVGGLLVLGAFAALLRKPAGTKGAA